MAFPMTDEELKKRIRNGTPIKILAELNGVSDQTIYNWMKKNGVERPKDEPEKKETAQVVAKVVPVENKIEVDEDVWNTIEGEIQDLERQIENFKKGIVYREARIDGWKKILAVIVKKEAPKDD